MKKITIPKINVKKVKIFVTVPIDNLEEVRTAMCNAGAGVIGNYTYCTSSTKVSGTYTPNDKANPYEGTANTLEFVEEIKLEFICDIKLVKEVLKITRNIHPYEEPCIDIIPLLNEENF